MSKQLKKTIKDFQDRMQDLTKDLNNQLEGLGNLSKHLPPHMQKEFLRLKDVAKDIKIDGSDVSKQTDDLVKQATTIIDNASKNNK